MGRRKKNNNQRRQQRTTRQASGNSSVNTPSATNPPEVIKPDPITHEEVVETANAVEFESEAKKEAYIQQLMDEIKTWEEEKESAESAAKLAKTSLLTLKTEIEELEKDKTGIQEELSNARSTIAEAEEKAAHLRSEADSYAENVRRAADEERLNTVAEAQEKAKSAWQAQIDDIESQYQELGNREAALAQERRELARGRMIFEDDKEMLKEEREQLEKKKERYASASPAVVDLLKTELEDERAKYSSLLERYEELSRHLGDMQAYVDTMRAELSGTDGAAKTVTVGEIIRTYKELRERYEKLSAIYSDYPNDEAIAILEEKARRSESLERENVSLTTERNRYRDEAVAAKNEAEEIRAVRRMAVATQALNEHLLKELESHKAALESRSGDVCASLTQVDAEAEDPAFIEDVDKRRRRQKITSLSALVDHVKNYAGSRRQSERLYYTDDDIRAFLAGMAVSRLVILQGMSGTGKSSLPRIFAEAISGFNKLIPVESSWRDRNELLGYYNDFNKKFNAKTFTVELYRSGKEQCRDIPTFIVLDEMNLARIEYYFSDFLAILQEPDVKKWLVELVSSDMRTLPTSLPKEIETKMQRESPDAYQTWKRIQQNRKGDTDVDMGEQEKEQLFTYLARIEQLLGAKNLIDGRKVRVTENVWFVGTANRDESTFEISDKVYDRAQVVSLNKKGVDEGPYMKVDPGFISASDLRSLFGKAIRENKVEQLVKERLETLDDVLMAKFDTSFGNRIVTQTIRFVAVFMAAGGTLENALDYQISTKIIRKIINSDNSEALLDLQARTSDYRETTRLLNKRLDELKY